MMNEVAVVGLGRMGSAMAATLARAGFAVTIHNRTPERAERVAAATGARVVATAREAAACPVVVVSLADDVAVTDTYGGSDGLIVGLTEGTVVIETSTVDPRTVRDLAPRVAETGASLLDAPVSSSVPAVEQGILTFMVGGDPTAAQRVDPVFTALGKRTFHLGDVGTGAAMKLAVNAVVHALNSTLSESLVLAERAGIDRMTAYDVFEASAAGAPFVSYKRAAFEDPEQAPTAFSLDLVAKDLRLVLALADQVGATTPQARANLAIAEDAIDTGLGERDMSWLAQRFRDAEPS
jgi:3-hydroxyisobutyrate dehydrogenase-like beta-hydroxyacid dehydrogenase